MVTGFALVVTACSDAVSIPNEPPSIGGVDAIACADGTCEVVLRVIDADADPVDLAVECLRASGTCTLTDGAGTDGRSGLTADRAAPGRTHLLVLAVEGPGPDEPIKLRFVPTDARELEGEAYTTPEFTLATGL